MPRLDPIIFAAWAFASFARTAYAAPPAAQGTTEPRLAEQGAAQQSIGQDDAVQPPTLLGNSDVPYPDGATGAAHVVLRVLVDERGNVPEAVTVEGAEPFSAAARQAVLGWTFAPARLREAPVSVRILVRVDFVEPKEAEVEPSGGGAPEMPAAAAPAVGDSDEVPTGEEVTITSRRQPGTSHVMTDAFTEIVPGAEGDPVRALEVLPGAVPILASGPFLGLRGAPPGKVGYEFDGIRIPYLFHLARAATVVHPWLIESAALYGAGPARLGRADGGFVEATAAPAERRHRATARLRITDAAAGAEAPFANGRGSVLVAGRYSYMQPILSLVAPSFSLNFWDYQGRIDYALSPDDSVELLALGAGDLSEQTSDEGVKKQPLNSSFHRLRLQYEKRTASGLQTTVSFVYGVDSSEATPGNDRPRSHQGSARLTLEMPVLEDSSLEFGADVVGNLQTDHVESDASSAELGEEYQRTDLDAATWAELVYVPYTDLTMALGLRLDAFSSDASLVNQAAVDFSAAPRYSVSYRVLEPLRLHQSIGLVTGRPSDSQRTPGRIYSNDGGLMYGVLGDFGTQISLPGHVSLDLTGYAGAFFNTNDLSTFEDLSGQPEGLERGTGRSYGLEIMLQRSVGPLRGVVSYTLGRSERSLGRAEGPSRHDRTHVLVVALGYDLGSGWSVSSRMTHYTGFPGRMQRVDEVARPPRSAPYTQFDVQAEKRWLLDREGAWLAVTLGMINATLQKDSADLDCRGQPCENNMIGPAALPTLGLEGAI